VSTRSRHCDGREAKRSEERIRPSLRRGDSGLKSGLMVCTATAVPRAELARAWLPDWRAAATSGRWGEAVVGYFERLRRFDWSVRLCPAFGREAKPAVTAMASTAGMRDAPAPDVTGYQARGFPSRSPHVATQLNPTPSQGRVRASMRSLLLLQRAHVAIQPRRARSRTESASGGQAAVHGRASCCPVRRRWAYRGEHCGGLCAVQSR
jgi:hypothetical protein